MNIIQNRSMYSRVPLASFSLNANSPAISAITNDSGYKSVFAWELVGIA